MKLPEPLASRLAPAKELTERFLREFEWTWARAVVFSVGIAFYLLISMAVIPSFWLYFADQQLKWDGSGPNGFWLLKLRDLVATGLTVGPFVTLIVAASVLQNWRRRLRGQTGEVRPTGGYR